MGFLPRIPNWALSIMSLIGLQREIWRKPNPRFLRKWVTNKRQFHRFHLVNPLGNFQSVRWKKEGERVYAIGALRSITLVTDVKNHIFLPW